MKKICFRSKATGLFFAGWETLGDNPWECQPLWVSLRENAIQVDPTSYMLETFVNQHILKDCEQVEVP